MTSVSESKSVRAESILLRRLFPSAWLDLMTCAGQGTLAYVAISRRAQSRVAVPLALFCTCVVAWSTLAVLYKVTGRIEWTLADHAVSPVNPAIALDFALTLDGRRRTLRAPLWVAYSIGAALGSVSIAAFFVPDLRSFIGSRAWTGSLVAIGVPPTTLALFSFIAHLQRSVERLEEERTRLVLAAFAIAAILGGTEVLGSVAPNLPLSLTVVPFHSSLGKVGLLVGTGCTALVTLEFPWFESPRRVRRFTYALLVLGIGVLVYVAVYQFADPMASRMLIGSVVVTAALIGVSRRWFVDAALRKERSSQLATLGRFSAQMAHDVKNPLAALKGAAQVVRDDVPAQSAPLVDLMLEQIDRIARVVETYGRLARIDLVRASVDVGAIVRDVVALQALAPAAGVRVRTQLASGLPECSADRDMIASVLENLVRNALEAMPASGGEVTVRTLHPPSGEPPGVEIVVEDTGAGMDAKTRERAFDDFFTTKTSGSGLGLAFVRRVVHAHGGEVALTSEPGRGTVVRIRLPAE